MPNSLRCFSCTTMKPCKCKRLLNLFECRSFSKFFKYLQRRTNRRRSSRRFRSIHAVFWPLMSMRSDERERAPENPSLTFTETEPDTVLRPPPIEPTPLTSFNTKVESTAPPPSSSHIKVEPTPPPISSNTNVEPLRPPSTSSYMKAEPNQAPSTSSYMKAEPNQAPSTSTYMKAEPNQAPSTSSYTKAEPSSTAIISSYVKRTAHLKDSEKKMTKEDFEVQKACRSFERYITEMLLDERKVRDLLDVEELMYCMGQLTSPAFIDLVCTFYGELCLDLFSKEGNELELDGK